MVAFVEQLSEMTKKGDRHRFVTHRHHLCPCTECGQAIYTDEPGKRRCKLTPGCPGRHVKPEEDTPT